MSSACPGLHHAQSVPSLPEPGGSRLGLGGHDPVPPFFMQNFPPSSFSQRISEQQAFSAGLPGNERRGDSPVPRLNLPLRPQNLSNVPQPRNLFGEIGSLATSQDSYSGYSSHGQSGYTSPNLAAPTLDSYASNIQAACVAADGPVSFASSPNLSSFCETAYAAEGAPMSLHSLAPVELQSSKYVPFASMSTERPTTSRDFTKLCQDIVASVVNGLQLEERHKDVMHALNAIFERLETLEDSSSAQVNVSKVTDVQESRRANNTMVPSRPGAGTLQRYAHDLQRRKEITQKADENWLQNMVMQVSSSLDKFSQDFQTENENMREILRNEVSLDEIATAVLNKLEKNLTVTIDDSEAMRSLRRMQEQLNRVNWDGSELMTNRQQMQEQVQVPDSGQLSALQALLGAQYSDMSRMLQKIFCGQLDQEAISDCIRRETSILLRDLSQTTEQLVEAFKWIKENHKSMLTAVKNMESQGIDVRAERYVSSDSRFQTQRGYDFSEETVQRTIIRQETGSPGEQKRSTPKRRVSFESLEEGKRVGSPRADSPGRAKTAISPRNGSVGDADQEEVLFACICGYTCGTAKALERHLTKFGGVPGHAAVKEY